MFLCFRTPIVSGTGQHKWSIKQLVKKNTSRFCLPSIRGLFCAVFMCVFLFHFSIVAPCWPCTPKYTHTHTHTQTPTGSHPCSSLHSSKPPANENCNLHCGWSGFRLCPKLGSFIFFLYPLPFIASLSSLVVGVIESHSNTPAYTPIKHTRQS